MYKFDPVLHTHQSTRNTLNPSLGCWRVGAEAVFVENPPAEVDELEIFLFGGDGDGGAKSAEAEAAMTPAAQRMMALGPGGVATARGWSISA
eukprot:scaffold83063_cov37-Cyclotella_meneghiniana.AAC.3